LKRPIFFLLLILATSARAWPDKGHCLVFLSGPGVSKHFHPYDDQFNDFHLGIGAEAYYRKGHWLLGANGHYMFSDSNERPSHWIGFAPGYLAGDLKKFWASLAVIAGGLKKAEYRKGRFALFALPYLAAGFNRLALNFALIPRIARVTEPILLVQVKILVHPFSQ
jgi:hypothetical protein